MRFRTVHLLVLTALAALLAYSLPHSNRMWTAAYRAVAWFILATVGIYAVANEGRRRTTALSALIMGLSYYLMTITDRGGELTELAVVSFYKWYYHPPFPSSNAALFGYKVDSLISMLFLGIGGMLGALFTRKRS